MQTHPRQTVSERLRDQRGPLAALLVVLVAFLAIASSPVTSGGLVGTAVAQTADAELDSIVLKNGRVVRGTIISETATSVRINIIVGGISAPAEYAKSEIVTINRGEGTAAAEGDDASGTPLDPMDLIRPGGGDDEKAIDPSTPTVYFMPMTGAFGSEIAPQPVEKMLEDVQKHEPDFLIVEIDRDWRLDYFTEGVDQRAASFDEFYQVEAINDMFLRSMQNWRKRPHVVMWVKNAMGGLAFTPFLGDTIIFHPDGRMGGIGSLEEMFGGTGDHVVRQKQRSLRLAQARGLAINGGHDPRLVDAMARRSYELSYRYDGGVAELFEGLPSKPGEFLLTEDGTVDENTDTLEDAVRGTGNDVLTLREDSAKRLGVSLGTAETEDDVLGLLRILRNHHRIDGRAADILEDWKDELVKLSRQVPRDLEELANIQDEDPARAISRRIAMLEKFLGYHRRYGQAMYFPRDFRPPPGQGVPGEPDLNVQIEQLRVQLMQLED